MTANDRCTGWAGLFAFSVRVSNLSLGEKSFQVRFKEAWPVHYAGRSFFNSNFAVILFSFH